jgi:hypothetical protein
MVYRKFIDANTDLYRTPYPPTNYYGPVNRRYGLLQDLLNYYGPIKTPYGYPHPSINYYGPANYFYGPYKTTTTRYVLYYAI